LILVAATVACSSQAVSDGGASASATAAIRRGASVPRQAPPARMFAGVDSVVGVLTRWCVGDDCTRGTRRPSRYLKGDPAGFVYFAVASAPAAARVEVRRGKKVVGRGSLRPGTSMAYALDVPPGRYVVTLIATWKGREARWVFGLTGPSRT